MQLSPRQPRTPFELSDSLKHQLNMYALAASRSVPRQLGMYAVVVGAAGMGLLALPELADAKIVYTKAHRIIGPGSTCRLIFRDAPDFSLWNNESDNGRTYSILAVAPLRRGNGAIGNGSYASALHQGSRIGASRDFLSGTARLVRGAWSTGPWYGPWVNVKNRYLGLKFQINGHVHYGWARMSVSVINGKGISAVLTGYAYETVPNKAIIAGKIKGPDVVTIQSDTAPGSLGRLALGRK